MQRATLSIGGAVALLAVGFLVEPWLPLGHWGWGIVAAIAMLPAAVLYRHKVWEFVCTRATFRKDPFRYFLVRRAYLAPGNGIHMAKLIQKARSVEAAREIFDIFDGSPGKERVADAYASYAQALRRFDCDGEAVVALMKLDDQGIPDIDIAEAKDRFFYPQDEGMTSEKTKGED